jgi:hypothetical protein
MAPEGASERRLGIGYFSYQYSMILVQALSQPMMTKKWRKNFAAPICVAGRQQRARSTEGVNQRLEMLIFLKRWRILRVGS